MRNTQWNCVCVTITKQPLKNTRTWPRCVCVCWGGLTDPLDCHDKTHTHTQQTVNKISRTVSPPSCLAAAFTHRQFPRDLTLFIPPFFYFSVSSCWLDSSFHSPHFWVRVCVCVEVFPSMCSSTYLAKVHSSWNASPAQHFPLKKSDRKRKIPFHFGIANDTKEKNIWVRHTRQPYLYFLSPERKRKKQVKETKQPIETLGVGCPMQVIRHTQPDYVIARLSHIRLLPFNKKTKQKKNKSSSNTNKSFAKDPTH